MQPAAVATRSVHDAPAPAAAAETRCRRSSPRDSRGPLAGRPPIPFGGGCRVGASEAPIRQWPTLPCSPSTAPAVACLRALRLVPRDAMGRLARIAGRRSNRSPRCDRLGRIRRARDRHSSRDVLLLDAQNDPRPRRSRDSGGGAGGITPSIHRVFLGKTRAALREPALPLGAELPVGRAQPLLVGDRRRASRERPRDGPTVARFRALDLRRGSRCSAAPPPAEGAKPARKAPRLVRVLPTD